MVKNAASNTKTEQGGGKSLAQSDEINFCLARLSDSQMDIAKPCKERGN